MKLTVVALNGQLSIQDPNPLEGIFSITLNQGDTGIYTVTPGQLERIKPALMDMESRTVDGEPLMSWAIDRVLTDDERAEVTTLLTTPKLTQMVGAGINPAGVADLEFVGTNLLAAQTKATIDVGDDITLGVVRYTAVKPGAPGNLITVKHVIAGLGTPLSVAVASNDIIVYLATDGAGVVTSTAANILTAVNTDAAAKLLVLATAPYAGLGQAAAVTNLAGGLGEGVSLKIGSTACSILSISNTSLHALVPALAGVAATDAIQVMLRSGGQVCIVTSPAYASAAAPASIGYAELTDAVYGDHEDQAGAGALTLTNRTALCTTAAPAAAVTIPDATVQGHRKTVVLTTVGTPGTDSISLSGTGGTWVLDAVNDMIELEWSGVAWILVNDSRASAAYADHSHRAGAGAIDVITPTTYLTTAAAGAVMTLADGVKTGQRKHLVLTTIGVPGTDTAVVTPAHGTARTLAYVGDAVVLEWDGANWILLVDGRIGTCSKIATTKRVAAVAYFQNPLAAELISIVADAACANGACALAGQPQYPCKLSLRVTIAVNPITAGVATIVSVGSSGEAITEVVSLITAVTATIPTLKAHGKITSITVSGLVGGGGAGDNLSVGQSSALGLPAAQDATSFAVHKANLDNADEAVGTVDAVAGTIIPTTAPNAARDYTIFYSYLTANV